MPEAFNLVQYLTVKRDKGVIVWLFNIGAEKYWNPVHAGIVDRSEDRIVNRVEEMNLLLCRPQDILILREQPDERYLAKLEEWGFSVPQFLVPEHGDEDLPISELVLRDEKLQRRLADLAADREDVHLVPYGVTHLEEQIAANCRLRLHGAPSQVNTVVNDKIFNRVMAEQLGFEVCQGKICHSVEEVRAACDELMNRPPFFEKVIIKEPYGASGKGLYIVESADKLSSILARISRFSRRNSEAKWLVEGWYRKKADINYQIYVSPEGAVDVFSIKRQILRDTVYIGSQMPAELDDAELQSYRAFGEAIGAYLFSIGYVGVAGIDSIIAEDGRIIPVIEVNGRFTLSTYISFVDRVLNGEKRFSRYFKIFSAVPYTHAELCAALEREGLLYRPERGEGVVIYTSGTLPYRPDQANGMYSGRMFALIMAPNQSALEQYNARLEAFVDGFLNVRSSVG